MRTRVVLLSLAICALAVAVSSPASGRSAPKNACPPGSTNTDYCQVAPGQYCKGLSKKKIPGQKKSPFAQCTSAMAKVRKRPSLAPRNACASLKAIKGKRNRTRKNRSKAKKGFNGCVKSARQLKLDLANS